MSYSRGLGLCFIVWVTFSILIRHRNALRLAILFDTSLEFITTALPYLLLSPCHNAED